MDVKGQGKSVGLQYRKEGGKRGNSAKVLTATPSYYSGYSKIGQCFISVF
jgi:hypothetical protein